MQQLLGFHPDDHKGILLERSLPRLLSTEGEILVFLVHELKLSSILLFLILLSLIPSSIISVEVILFLDRS